MFLEQFIFLTINIALYRCSDILQCQFATKNKYLGYFSVNPGTTNRSPFGFVKRNNSDDCRESCRIKDGCLAASYNATQYCSFYNSSLLNIRYDNSYDNVVYSWYRCNWPAWVKEPTDGRCQGMFITYVNTKTQFKFQYMELYQILNVRKTICLDNCTNNPMCSVLNYYVQEGRCTLYQGWPRDYLTKINQSMVNTYEWSCIPNYFETLTPNKIQNKPKNGKCKGTWNIMDLHKIISNVSSPGAFFYTQSFNTCLSECNENLNCSEVLFNASYSVCLIPGIDSSHSNKYYVSFTFIQFKWICNGTSNIAQSETDSERKYKRLGLKCVTLINNTDVWIMEDNCGKPAPTTLTKCTKASLDGEWTVGDSCLINQTFWMFPNEKYEINLSKNVTRIFTGLTSYWIIHSTTNIFQYTSYLECRRFDSSRTEEKVHILSRETWYALPSLSHTPLVSLIPPQYIIIDSSEIPFFGCRTIMTCSSILRNLQIRYFKGIGPIPKLDDIPYNFMIDESGNVYHIRGWTQRCAAFPDYPDSLCFAFIGSFNEALPTIGFLQGAKKLINFAVDAGYVSKNYKVIVYGDATRLSKRRNLALIIKNWYRYRGFMPQICSNISDISIVINCVVVVFVCVILLMVYKMFYPQRKCKKCLFLQNVEILMIYPVGQEGTDIYRGPHDSFHTRHCIITEKSNIFSPPNTFQFAKFVKMWLLNRFVESHNSRQIDNTQRQFLNTCPGAFKHLQVYEGNKTSDSLSSLNLNIVLCFSNAKSHGIFEQLRMNQDCLCRSFDIDFQSYSDLTFHNS